MHEKVVEKVDSYFSAGYDALLKSGWERIKKELVVIEKTANNTERDEIIRCIAHAKAYMDQANELLSPVS